MTIFGPDISNNNGVVNIDRVADEGYAFVFAKVSEGAGFRDRFWPRTRDWCKARGLICVGYHYVKLDNADAQARNFRDNGGGARVMLDFEAGSGGIDNFWDNVRAFNSIGIQVVLSYIPRWYWDATMGRPDLSNIPGMLISSNYRPYTDQATPTNGWAPYGGRTPDIWQYTDNQTVAGLSMDCNAFRGSKAELAARLGIGGITGGLLMALNDAEQQEVLDGVRLIVAQLLGTPDPNRPGVAVGWPQLDNQTLVNALARVLQQVGPWPQLGHNAKGEPLTPVDALAAVKDAVVPKKS